MTDEQSPHDEPVDEQVDTVSFGTATPAGQSRSLRAGKAAAWVAAGALGATVLTGVAYAASRTNSATPSPSANAPTAPRGYGGPGAGANGDGPGGGTRGGPLGGRLQGIGGAGAVLHGDLVVKTKSGSTKSVLVQNGKVTAASLTSLTVLSTDGFSATWTLNSSTAVRKFTGTTKKAAVGDLAVGDQVLVAGAKISDTSGTAALVRVQPTAAQLKTLMKNRPKGQFRMGGPMGGAPKPAPTGSASGQTTADDLGLDPAELNALGA